MLVGLCEPPETTGALTNVSYFHTDCNSYVDHTGFLPLKFNHYAHVFMSHFRIKYSLTGGPVEPNSLICMMVVPALLSLDENRIPTTAPQSQYEVAAPFQTAPTLTHSKTKSRLSTPKTYPKPPTNICAPLKSLRAYKVTSICFNSGWGTILVLSHPQVTLGDIGPRIRNQ